MDCQGTVISVDGKKAKVKVTTSSECIGCSSINNCHSNSTESRNVTVLNEYGAKVSDEVIFEADTSKVILSAALIWILPLISMILGYIVGERFASGLWAIGTAFIFLFLAFIFLKYLDMILLRGKTFYPKITKIIHSSKVDNNI